MRVPNRAAKRRATKDDGRSILLLNIRQLLTLRSASNRPGPRCGAALSDLGIIENAAVLCVGGKIVSAGKTKDALRDSWLRKNRKQNCRS